MSKNYTFKALETAINHGLNLDPTTRIKLEELQSKVIKIIIEPLNLSFFMTFDQGKLILLNRFDGEANTIIHGNLFSLIRLLTAPNVNSSSLFKDKVKLSGDIELAQQIKQLFSELDIDWEGYMARLTGDALAHQLGSLFRRGLAWQQQFVESIQSNAKDYLHDELRLLPSSEEVNDFFHDVDELSLAIERLEAKINQLLIKNEIY